jgi:hypothetical protein
MEKELLAAQRQMTEEISELKKRVALSTRPPTNIVVRSKQPRP